MVFLVTLVSGCQTKFLDLPMQDYFIMHDVALHYIMHDGAAAAQKVLAEMHEHIANV